MGHPDQRFLARRQWAGGGGEHILQRAEHQGQRCAKLMTDVREEGGLRAIDFRQRLGAPALLLIGVGVGETGGDLAGDEIDETEPGLIVAAVRIDAGDQEPGGFVLTLARDRRDHRLHGRLLPAAGWDFVEAAVEAGGHHGHAAVADLGGRPDGVWIGRIDDGGGNGMARADAGHAGQPRQPVGVEQIRQGERQIPEIAAKPLPDRVQDFGAGEFAGDFRREFTQAGQAPLADDPVGFLGDHAQHADDRAAVVGQRRV